jgi:hypothetical protein
VSAFRQGVAISAQRQLQGRNASRDEAIDMYQVLRVLIKMLR